MTSTKIGNRAIGGGAPCFIVMEVGINHNGDPELAHKMVDVAADAGADCVKFQTFHAEEFMNGPDQSFEYISQGETVTESMLAMFKRCELADSEFSKLFDHARQRGLTPLSTPTDYDSVDLLHALGAEAFKVGSDDIVYTPFLRHIASKGKPVIISTGMADSADVDRAVVAIRETGNQDIIILHCVSIYPTPDPIVNLQKIATYADRYGLPVGYSDHSDGYTAALGAVALGACVVEKHFTLSRDLPGPDHRFSSDPVEMTTMVREIRRLEKNMGSPDLIPAEGEEGMAEIARRSIVLARDVSTGDIIDENMLIYVRPGTGLMPYEVSRVAGRRATCQIAAGTLLAWDMLD